MPIKCQMRCILFMKNDFRCLANTGVIESLQQHWVMCLIQISITSFIIECSETFSPSCFHCLEYAQHLMAEGCCLYVLADKEALIWLSTVKSTTVFEIWELCPSKISSFGPSVSFVSLMISWNHSTNWRLSIHPDGWVDSLHCSVNRCIWHSLVHPGTMYYIGGDLRRQRMVTEMFRLLNSVHGFCGCCYSFVWILVCTEVSGCQYLFEIQFHRHYRYCVAFVQCPIAALFLLTF